MKINKKSILDKIRQRPSTGLPQIFGGALVHFLARLAITVAVFGLLWLFFSELKSQGVRVPVEPFL